MTNLISPFPYVKNLTLFLGRANGSDLTHCTHFTVSPFFNGFVSPLQPNTPNDKFDKPLRNKILTTDFLSPYVKNLTSFLGRANGSDLTHCTHFMVSPFFDGFVIPLQPNTPNDKFDKPLRNKILTTDFLSPYVKNLTLFLGRANGSDLTHCTHFTVSPFFNGFVSPLQPNTPNDKFDKPLRNKILTTDFLSPYVKNLTPFLGRANGSDLTHCTHFIAFF